MEPKAFKQPKLSGEERIDIKGGKQSGKEISDLVTTTKKVVVQYLFISKRRSSFLNTLILMSSTYENEIWCLFYDFYIANGVYLLSELITKFKLEYIFLCFAVRAGHSRSSLSITFHFAPFPKTLRQM